MSLRRYAYRALKDLLPVVLFLLYVFGGVYFYLRGGTRALDRETPFDHKAECKETEQRWDGGCVSNEEWIARNLADEVPWIPDPERCGLDGGAD